MAISRCGVGSALLAALCCLAAPGSWRSPARAATIEVIGRPECSLRLKGRIEAGDAAALENILRANSAAQRSICLDSAGGDLGEALKIVDLMNVGGQYFQTVVDRDEACRAECAFVFLAGRYTEYHSVTFPSRRLHVAGILEFRPPGPAPSGSAASGAVVAAAYAESVASVSQILRREHEHGDPTGDDPIDHNRTFPLSLLLAILGAEPGHAFRVETIDQAGRWGIQLFGLPPIAATDAVLLQACENKSRWGGWLHGNAGEIGAEKPKMVSPDLLKVSLRGLDAGDPVPCMASRYRDATGADTISVGFTPKGESENVPDAAADAKLAKEGGGEYRLGTPLWTGLPPETRLDSVTAK